MASKEEVEQFLRQFYQKLEIYGGKNLSTLALLDIPPSARTKIIKRITVEDYSEGPIIDKKGDKQ